MLDLLRGAADLYYSLRPQLKFCMLTHVSSFADDTRIHILHILFRLALDASLVRNSMVCSELERTITAVLESLPHDTSDSIVSCTMAAANKLLLTFLRFTASVRLFFTPCKTLRYRVSFSSTYYPLHHGLACSGVALQ